MNSQNLNDVLISLKTILIFPKNFLIFRSDMIEKHGILSLSTYSNKSSVVLSNSVVIFLGEEDDAAFCPFLYCSLVISYVT